MTYSPMTEVFFIVDGDRLEAQACLLAPTLKRHLMPHQRAVAYVREDYIDQLQPFTTEVLEASGVELRTIPGTSIGHAPWQAPYPHGNKILAAATPRNCEISVFLDTDTVLTSSVEFGEELGDAMIAACVSDYSSATGSLEDWEAFYALYDMEVPEDRVQLNAGRKLLSVPYYNAGVIIFRERTQQGWPTDIAQDWLHAAVKFERDMTHPYTRSNIDQFTLPILGYLRGSPVKALDQHMNFNIQGFGDGEGERQSVAHYHRIGALWKHNTHGRETLELLADTVDESAPQTFLEVFGLHARRKDMKHHLRAMAEAA